ncbi:hypothetical protein KAR91_46785 [Candidatus Pacearchaeota archaeon]|nr:hypothetical protein [Candidatus Pacearchaeota archaeon]
MYVYSIVLGIIVFGWRLQGAIILGNMAVVIGWRPQGAIILVNDKQIHPNKLHLLGDISGALSDHRERSNKQSVLEIAKCRMQRLNLNPSFSSPMEGLINDGLTS